MVRYRVIAEMSLQSFCGACEEALRDGWELSGGVVIRDREFLQSLTKMEESVSAPKKKRGRPKGKGNKNVTKNVSKGKAVRAKK